MKLLNAIISPYYSIERRSCVGQLRDDFGNFPPTPLRCDGLSGEFDVVRTRGIGDIWHTLIVFKRMLLGLESGHSTFQVISLTILAPTRCLPYGMPSMASATVPDF